MLWTNVLSEIETLLYLSCPVPSPFPLPLPCNATAGYTSYMPQDSLSWRELAHTYARMLHMCKICYKSPIPANPKVSAGGWGLGAGAGWGLELKGDSALIRKRFAATLMARFQ